VSTIVSVPPNGATADGAWPIVHVDLAAGPLPPAPPGESLVVFWWRDLPLGHMLPGRLPSSGTGAAGAAKAHSRDGEGWARAVAYELGLAVAARLRPQSVTTWLPGQTRPPGPDSDVARAVGGLHGTLRALDDTGLTSVDGVDASNVSIVICTRDRPRSLATTLSALAVQQAPPGEVVVVENGPTTAATRGTVAAFPLARYVHEPRPGLSAARNAGLRAATGEVVAFTDDDADPHPAWAGQVARAFARDPELLAVTGLVLPADLDSEAARLFEFGMGGFSQGYVPLDYDAEWFGAAGGRGTPVWKVGAGANMAFRRRAFALVGGFDERLGAGAAGCSEDSELWYRLVAAGHTCRYEPAAVVFHHHRSDVAGLRAQASAYLEGHLAALFVEFSRYRRPGELLRAFVNLPAFLGDRAVRERVARAKGRASNQLIGPELRGYRAGLRHARLALRPVAPPTVVTGPDAPPARRAERRAFLAANPFPHPYTEGFFFREKMRAIHRVTPDGEVRRVLEVGGGGSALTARLFPGADIVTVDLDAAYGAQLAARGEASRFVPADAVRLPFADGAFDAVTMFDVLEHIPDDARALGEVRRVTRPGGLLLASSPNERWRFPYYRALAPVCPRDVDVMAEWGHVRRGYRLDDLDRLVGLPHARAATFISPVTVVGHDLSFSRLPGRVRRALVAALSPITWLAYALHRPFAPGTETAAAWVVPDGGR
jgi:GT2 family glycosyltransferase/SAM-dependent methyltransferase